MTEPVPIACALTPDDLAGQARRWQRLIGRALTARTETADGLRLRFRPESEAEMRALEAEVRALAAVESECCPWASWTVTAGSGEVTLDVRATAGEVAEGAAVLREVFRGGPASPSGVRASAS